MTKFAKIGLAAIVGAGISTGASAQSLKTYQYTVNQPATVSQVAPTVTVVPQPIMPAVTSTTLAPVTLPNVTTVSQPTVTTIGQPTITTVTSPTVTTGQYTTAPAVVSSACTGVVSLKTASYCTPQQLTQSYTIPTTSVTTPSVLTPTITTTSTTTTPVVQPSVAPLNITAPDTTAAIQPIATPTSNSGLKFYIGGEGGISLPSISGRLSNLTLQTRAAGVTNKIADNDTTGWDASGSYDIGYHAGGRFGVMLDSGLYAGLDGMYRYAAYQNTWTTGTGATYNQQIISSKVNTVAAFLTGGFAFDTGSLIRPFGEISVGYALNTTSGNLHQKIGTAQTDSFLVAFPESESAGLAFGASIGSGFLLTDNVEARIGYRYRNLGAASSGTESTSKTMIDLGTIEAHELYVGVNYMF